MHCEPGNRNITRWNETATALRLAGKPTVPTTIEHKRAVNPFLRIHEPEIRDVLIDTFNVPVPHRLAAFLDAPAECGCARTIRVNADQELILVIPTRRRHVVRDAAEVDCGNLPHCAARSARSTPFRRPP